MYRLNLPYMLDSQINGPIKPANFNAQFFNGNPQSNESARLLAKTDIRTSLNNIVASVHQKLKNKRPQAKLGPAIPDTIKNIGTDPLQVAKPQTKSKELNISKTVPGSNATSSTKSKFKPNPNGSMNRTKSIAKIKASHEQKSQQRMRRSIGAPNDSNNFTTRKRIEEIEHQKRVLQEMLAGHLKLKRDRQSIALEIRTMRSHLDEIRNKLDNSLKKLNNNQPVVKSPDSRQQRVIRPNSKQRKISLHSRLSKENTIESEKITNEVIGSQSTK